MPAFDSPLATRAGAHGRDASDPIDAASESVSVGAAGQKTGPEPGAGRGARRIEPCHITITPDVRFRPNFAGCIAAPLGRQSALSPALDHGAVLGRQRHRRPPCRRPYSSRNAVVPALVDRLPPHSALDVEASEARLAGDPWQARRHGAAVGHRHWCIQHAAILGARTHAGTEYLAPAIVGAAHRRGLVLDPAWRTADARTGDRRSAVAERRAGDPLARRPRRLVRNPLQQGRPDLPRRNDHLRALFGADAEASGHSLALAGRLYLWLRRGRPHSALDLGAHHATGDGLRCAERAESRLRR